MLSYHDRCFCKAAPELQNYLLEYFKDIQFLEVLKLIFLNKYLLNLILCACGVCVCVCVCMCKDIYIIF